jgi:hypothetical protein
LCVPSSLDKILGSCLRLLLHFEHMASIEELRALCFDEAGAVKEKPACRAVLINHLILEELMDVDEAEELTEDTLNQLGLWPNSEQPVTPDEEDQTKSSTDA